MTVCAKSLQSKVSSFIDLADMLATYVGVNKNEFISHDEFVSAVTEGDVLWDMAEQNGMSEDDMSQWVWDNATNKVTCYVIEENGPAGGWPVVKVECADKTFFFDWAE